MVVFPILWFQSIGDFFQIFVIFFKFTFKKLKKSKFLEILLHNKIHSFLKIWHFFQIYTSTINISQYFFLLLMLEKFAKQKNHLSYRDEILIKILNKITMDKENKVKNIYTLLCVR
jgi:hypothetical protein